jgi:hypothetical protein
MFLLCEALGGHVQSIYSIVYSKIKPRNSRIKEMRMLQRRPGNNRIWLRKCGEDGFNVLDSLSGNTRQSVRFSL